MQHRLSGYGVELRSVAQSDIETLREWRNREDIRSMMKSTTYITEDQQQAWFESLEDATHVRHFVISYKGEDIGSSTLTGLSFVSGFTDDLENAEEIEPGLYIGHENYRNNILAFAPSLVICDYCFDELQVKKLRATVNASNKQALSYNQKLGYTEESRFFTASSEEGEAELVTGTSSTDTAISSNKDNTQNKQEWVAMTLHRKDYVEATKQIKDFLSRRKSSRNNSRDTDSRDSNSTDINYRNNE